ncbi:MAG: hypothetical protein JSU63_12115 [Phycisphaerales bacterium]|nr:MAG: hypothetical protein JSU63_12115 [Phycisphaerales bacterium]
MCPTTGETQEFMTEILEALDAAAGLPPDNSEQRRESRRPLRAKCELHLFIGPDPEPAVFDAVVRNITFSGLSVVITTRQSVRSGRPVEAVVEMPDYTRSYLAGIVAFCRRVDDECYEMGIEVKAAGNCPVVINDLQESRELYDWFAAALKVPE